MWYNKALFKEKGWEVPKTWDEFFELGKKAKDEGIALYTYQGQAPGYNEAVIFPMLASAAGEETVEKIFNYEEGAWKDPNVKKALFADAIGTTVGACLGTSTVSTFVESASGVAEGGRTGLTAVTTAVMFLISLFFAPIFGVITSAVTASALVLVGLFMIEPIKSIDLEDFTEAIPAFLTLIMMPLAYSISDGIVFGVISYIILKLVTGRYKEISIATYVVGFIFILKFLVV